MMNEELLQFYITGLANGWFLPASNTYSMPEHIEGAMRKLERNLDRKSGSGRETNPEWAEAKKLYTSPLYQALR